MNEINVQHALTKALKIKDQLTKASQAAEKDDMVRTKYRIVMTSQKLETLLRYLGRVREGGEEVPLDPTKHWRDSQRGKNREELLGDDATTDERDAAPVVERP
jgi:hypothetical protein